MEDKYQNKYRIPSARLKGWDYSGNGMYFITICIHNHECVFGNVENYQMRLNELGRVARDEWLRVFKHRKNIIMDVFVIMPNHMHGIVLISDDFVETRQGASVQRSVIVKTRLGASPNGEPETHQGASVQNRFDSNKFGPMPSGGLASIINQYKGAVKRWCNKNGYPDFKWLSKYHDHIIRNEISLYKIRDYIINNPANWFEDEFYRE